LSLALRVIGRGEAAEPGADFLDFVVATPVKMTLRSKCGTQFSD